jgi:hypothetical protein
MPKKLNLAQSVSEYYMIFFRAFSCLSWLKHAESKGEFFRFFRAFRGYKKLSNSKCGRHERESRE